MALWAYPADGKKKSDNDKDDVVSHAYVYGSKDFKRSVKLEEGYGTVVIDPEASQDFVTEMNGEFCKKKVIGQHVLMRYQVSVMVSLSNDANTIIYVSCVNNLVKHMVRSSRLVVDDTAQYGLIDTNNPGFGEIRHRVGPTQTGRRHKP